MPRLPALFTIQVSDQQLTCCVQHAFDTGTGPRTSYQLLAVDAIHQRGWRSEFSVTAVNAALADEELSAEELDHVLATVLPCQGAVTAEQHPEGGLRLEAWCHRTKRVPLLPPPPQQQKSNSDYRQTAFCISIPVNSDGMAQEQQWMPQHVGESYAAVNAGLLDAALARDQQQQQSLQVLQSQLHMLYSFSAQLQLLADRAVKAAVAGTPGLKQLPDQPQQHSRHVQQRPSHQQDAVGVVPEPKMTPEASQPAADAEAAAVLPFVGTQASPGPLSPLLPGAAAPGGPAHAPWSTERTSGALLRAGSGGLAGGASGGGRAHLARQSQGEAALRQLWGEQQTLMREWQQLQPLIVFQGCLQDFLQAAAGAGRVGEAAAAAAGSHASSMAVSWHLGEQPAAGVDAQQSQLLQHLQWSAAHPQDNSRNHPAGPTACRLPLQTDIVVLPGALQVPGRAPPAAARETVNMPSAAAAAGLDGGEAAVAIVAPAKQKQTGHKRKAREGGVLLTRGRR